MTAAGHDVAIEIAIGSPENQTGQARVRRARDSHGLILLDAIEAAFDLTRRGAAIAINAIPVVAGFSGVAVSVATGAGASAGSPSTATGGLCDAGSRTIRLGSIDETIGGTAIADFTVVERAIATEFWRCP